MVVWLIASAAFAFYVANFGSYNKTYGSLGGVIVFLVWLWITNVAILLGAELNAESERSRELKEGVRAPSGRSSSSTEPIPPTTSGLAPPSPGYRHEKGQLMAMADEPMAPLVDEAASGARPESTVNGDKPAGDLVKDLSSRFRRWYVRSFSWHGSRCRRRASARAWAQVAFGGAGVMALYGGAALLAAIVLLIATSLEPWIAALIVAAALFLIAGVLALSGKKQVEQVTPPPPSRDREHEARCRRSEGEGEARMTPDAANPQQQPAEGPEALKDEIRQTRDDLGDTVEALAQKADVKAQAKQRIDEGKEQLRDYRQQAQAQAAQATEQAKQRPEAVIAGVGGLIALLLLLRIIRR